MSDSTLSENKITGANKQKSLFGPGQLLRQAREDHAWRIEDAAKKLNVIKSTIIAIENDDYEQIGSVVFIKGYLRLYARVLGVNEHDVINQFLKTAPKQLCEIESDVSGSRQANSTKNAANSKKRSLFKWW